MKYIIDRFEGEFAVAELEDQSFVNIPKVAVPVEAKEGDVILVQVDRAESESRRKHIKNLMDAVWED